MTPTDLDLVVIGDLNADLILQGQDPVPAFGQVEKLVDLGLLTIGGSSGITACGAARLGLRTASIGVLGDDALGSFMRSALTERGVDVSACPTDAGRQTGISVILAPRDGGGRAILTAPGTIDALTADLVPLDVVGRARHIHCGAYFLQPRLHDGLAGLFQRAHEMGLTCSLDTNWDPTGIWDGHLHDVLRHCDIFFPNEAEALHITGETTIDAALAALMELGLTVALKQGASGGAVARDGRVTQAPIPPIDAVVDTTGAGDSFNAGYLYGFLSGWDPGPCLALALACGSLSTRALGGTDAQPALEQALTVASRVAVAAGQA